MNSATFMFCKRCGAVTKPGICSYCGYDNELWQKKQYEASEIADQAEIQQTDLTVENQAETFGDNSETDEFTQTMDAASASEETVSEENNQNASVTEELPEYKVEEPIYSNFDPELLNENKKKKRKALPFILGIGIPVTVLLFIGMLLFGALVPLLTSFIKPSSSSSSSSLNQPQISVKPNSSENKTSERPDAISESDLEENGTDVGLFGERKAARKSLGDSFKIEDYLNGSAEYSDETSGQNDIFLEKGYISSFGTDHTNQDRDSFTPPYILAFAESIDTEVDYEFIRHYVNFHDTINGIDVTARIAYYEVSGEGIPNLDELNKKIREQSCNELYYYLKNGSTYGEYRDIMFTTDSYVTYNDEDKFSILLDIDVEVDNNEWDGYSYYNYSESYIYGINVDMIDGEVLDNSKILNVDEDFAKAFRKQCCDQNGYDIDGLNNMSNTTLVKFLSSKESSICFLTPLGLEYGYHYRSSSGSGQVAGWMTITLQNYFDKLQDDYRDLFEGTKKRPEPASEPDSEELSEENDVGENSSDQETSSEKSNDKDNSSEKDNKNKVI